MQYIEEEMTLAEFSKRFLNNEDFKTPVSYDVSDFDIQVDTPNGYKPIKSFLVKPNVTAHYSDGIVKGTANHRIIDNGNEIHLKDHPGFSLVDEPMDVVDIEVEGEQYFANGRIHHNTTSGGKAIDFHKSIGIRLAGVSKIKDKDKNTIGVRTKAVVKKTRFGPPFKEVEFDIFFDRGLDNYGNWLEFFKEKGVFTGSRTPYKYTRDNGEEISIPKDELVSMLESDEDLKNELYEKLCDLSIMKYRDQSQCASDDIIYDDGGEETPEL